MELLETHYTCTDYDVNYIRDVSWENTFKLDASTASFECTYVYFIELARPSLIHFHRFQDTSFICTSRINHLCLIPSFERLGTWLC